MNTSQETLGTTRRQNQQMRRASLHLLEFSVNSQYLVLKDVQ